MKGHNYTPEQIEWLSMHYPMLSTRAMTEKFNSIFGTDIKPNALAGTCKRRGIQSGRTGHFPKGTTAWNTGIKGNRVSPTTEFKKGNLPHNTKELGAERVNKDGIVEIKIAHGKWRSKHSILWEGYHGKAIPKGHVVIFADSDRRNFDPGNLHLVSRAELANLNKNGYSMQHPEIKPVLLNIVKLDEKIRIKSQRENRPC